MGKEAARTWRCLERLTPQSQYSFFGLPSIVGIASDSVCPMLSHYYSVCPRLSTHYPRLYPNQSSTLTCQGSLAKIELPRVGGCNLYTCMPVHQQIPPPTLIGYCILSILIFEDREVYLHASSVLLVPSPLLGTPGSV